MIAYIGILTIMNPSVKRPRFEGLLVPSSEASQRLRFGGFPGRQIPLANRGLKSKTEPVAVVGVGKAAELLARSRAQAAIKAAAQRGQLGRQISSSHTANVIQNPSIADSVLQSLGMRRPAAASQLPRELMLRRVGQTFFGERQMPRIAPGFYQRPISLTLSRFQNAMDRQRRGLF
ncbi:MAG: hypothetical protein AABX01_03775 [Candidatus Micrarchaeota archaeon]